MAGTCEKVFSNEEMNCIRSSFSYVSRDRNGENRLFLDNAGGSLRLTAAEKAFHEADLLPDCSEHSNSTAGYLGAIEEKGKHDILNVLFDARKGVLFPGFTASKLMMEGFRAISGNARGSNYVTSVMEHPSAFDAVRYYAKEHGCEMRVARADPSTGGVTAGSVLSLVDRNTAVLSCMAASNFSGYIYDIEEIARGAREINPDIFIICDAVQHAPHAALSPEAAGIDFMNFAPYKFFSVRGFSCAYVSERAASFMHHRLLDKSADTWELGSPAPGHYAAFSEVVKYVSSLGRGCVPAAAGEREIFAAGMDRIAARERFLLETALEGTRDVPGLRYISGVHVPMDAAPLEKRDFIIGVEFSRLSADAAAREYEKRGIITFERLNSSIYSRRMTEAVGTDGVVRVSPLHVNTAEEIEAFLAATAEIAKG